MRGGRGTGRGRGGRKWEEMRRGGGEDNLFQSYWDMAKNIICWSHDKYRLLKTQSVIVGVI